MSPTKSSVCAALIAAGFVFAVPTNAATIGGSLGKLEVGENVVQKAHYRPYKHSHRNRVYRRHRHAHVYRPYYRSYHNDYYVYRRPTVTFGFGVPAYRYYDDRY